MIEKINESVEFIKNIYSQQPSVGIVLGSGLGNFTNEIKIEKEIPYGDIPHFPVSTVAGHKGKLVFGEIEGKKVVAMAGRFHYYEGYDMEQVMMPVRTFGLLGIENVILLPHIGSASHATRTRMARLAASAVASVLEGGMPPNVVPS